MVGRGYGMEITEVRVSLREHVIRGGSGAAGQGEKRLKAYVTVTFDHCFIVRNMKVIEGKNGLFVAMPSHKPKAACARCHFKNDVGARYCTACGSAVSRPMEMTASAGAPESLEAQAHRDIAHPITVEFRQYLQRRVLEAYDAERTKEKQPGGFGVDQAGDDAV